MGERNPPKQIMPGITLNTLNGVCTNRGILYNYSSDHYLLSYEFLFIYLLIIFLCNHFLFKLIIYIFNIFIYSSIISLVQTCRLSFYSFIIDLAQKYKLGLLFLVSKLCVYMFQQHATLFIYQERHAEQLYIYMLFYIIEK